MGEDDGYFYNRDNPPFVARLCTQSAGGDRYAPFYHLLVGA
jgi:hypothetical protein